MNDRSLLAAARRMPARNKAPRRVVLRGELLERRRLLASDFLLSPADFASSYDSTSYEVSALLAAPSTNPPEEPRERPFSPPASTTLMSATAWLSQPTSLPPLEAATAFLTAHAADLGLTPGDLDQFLVTDQYVSEHIGVTHLYLQQTWEGLPIANAVLNINLTAAGEVMNVGSSFLSGLDARDAAVLPALSPAQALTSLASFFEWGLDAPRELHKEGEPGGQTRLTASGVSQEEIPAELHYVATENGSVELAWRLNVQTVDKLHWYDASVSAVTGAVLQVIDWVAEFADYRFYRLPLHDPDDGPRSLERDPHHPVGSPYGWHDFNGVLGREFTDTRGNNVWAQEDRDANNSGGFRPDGAAGGGNLAFDFPIDLGQAPLAYEAAAITNLFAMNNALHDIHVLYGFTEAAGNFQEVNYSGQGLGSDYVVADAQDGSGFNNANFASPPDGQNPRMQQYLFDRTNPHRDSSLHNEIITHEYGHGVSNRLTGGPANAGALQAVQSRAMGEGWSDWWALMLTQKPADTQHAAYPAGAYVLGQPPHGPGGRNYPYSFDMEINPLTYEAVRGANSPHDAGEVWCAVLWDMNWLLIDKHGYEPDVYNAASGKGNTLALQLVMDALKLQPANPSMLQARDAILLADRNLTGGANQLEIWTAFARRGMGLSAFDGGHANTPNVTEAFDIPVLSQGAIELDQETYAVGDPVGVTVRDADLAGAGSVAILLTVTGGDSESLTLGETPVPGVFTGAIDTAAGAVLAGNGRLEALGGQVITAAYNDANNGAGVPATASDAANVIALVDIFQQDFEQGLGSGESVSGAFTVNNLNAPLSNGTFMVGHPAPYGNHEYSYYQATVDLRAYRDISLQFDYAAQLENFRDGFNVLAAVGAVQPPQGLLFPVSGMPYDGKSGASLPLGLTGFDGDGALVSGVAHFDLSPYAGHVVTLRFQFGSNESVSGAGVKLDNLRIRGLEDDRPPSLLVNPSFETGDFAGWTTSVNAAALEPWTVSQSGDGSGHDLAPTEPQQGRFNAWNGFDGAQPMEFYLYQDVTLPAGAENVSISWKDRIQWDFTPSATVAQPRTYEVQLRDTSDNVLETLFSFSTGPEATNPRGDTGWQTRTAAIQGRAGATVRLYIRQVIPQVMTGPGQIEFDDFQMRAGNGTTAQIQGRKWNDLDGDGVRDAGEPGLPGWTVYADLNQDGDRDGGEPFAATDANGDYVLTVAPGAHTIREESQTGWRQTSPRARLFAVRGETSAFPIIYELDGAGTVLNSFPAPAPTFVIGPQGLATGPRSLFYIDGEGRRQHTLYELDLNTGAVLDADLLPIADEIAGLAFLNGRVYVEYDLEDQIAVFNPQSDLVEATLSVAADLVGGLTGVADLNLLFDSNFNGQIFAIDPNTGAIINTLSPGVGPLNGGLAFFQDALIAAGFGGSTAFRIDPVTAEVLGRLPLGGTGALSALAGDSQDAHTIVLTAGESVGGLDFGNQAIPGASLSLVVDEDSISEGDGAAATLAILTRTGDTTRPLNVNLSSSDDSEALVPAVVTIPAGEDSVIFPVHAVDDVLVDGPQAVTLAAQAALGGPAGLDPLFGAGGTAPVPLQSDRLPGALAVLPDGKILAAAGDLAANSWRITRLHPDGSLDMGFGTGGVAVTPFPLGFPAPHKIVLLPDGKFLVGGALSATSAALARYEANGALDSTFGIGGLANLSGLDGFIADMALRADGKLMLAIVYNGFPAPFFRAARVTANGTLDGGFGVGGVATSNTVAGPTYGLALLDDGRYLLAGGDKVARFLENGAVDSSFAAGGVQTVNFGRPVQFFLKMDLDSNGRIVLAAAVEEDNFVYDMAAARLTANGDIDATFSGDGKAIIDLARDDRLASLVVQPDDKIVLVGGTEVPGTGVQTALVRYRVDGSLDPAFDGEGILQLPMVADPNQRVLSAARADASSLFVLAGSPTDLRIARFFLGETPLTAEDDLIVNDNDTPALTVAIAASSVSEAAGANAATGIVTRNTAPASPLTVNLSSSDATEATVPVQVTIPAGQFSATFAVNAVDDMVVDGPQTVTITATAVGHAGGADTLTVADNDRAPPTISAVEDQVTDEDIPLGPLAFTIGDLETAAADLGVTAAASNAALVPHDRIVLGGAGANRTLTITPAAHQSGTAVITLTVTDGDGIDATETFLLTVHAVNDPPTVSAVADVVTDEDTPTGALAFTVGDVETDAGALLVRVDSSNTTLVPLANIELGGSGANRTVTVAPAADLSGSATITLTVADGAAHVTETFLVTVNSVNDAPTITPFEDLVIDEGDAGGPLAFRVGDRESAADFLTVTASSSNTLLVPASGFAFSGAGGERTLTVTPAADQFGAAVVTVAVSDGQATASETFLLTVAPVNDAPTISAVEDVTIDEDAATGALAFRVSDLETPADALSVAATSSDLTLVPTDRIVVSGAGGERTVVVTPSANRFGAATITLTVSDGVTSASESFVVTVKSVNDVPAISALADVTTDEDTATGALVFTVDDLESPTSSLTVTAVSSHPALVPQGNIALAGSGAARTVTVAPAANQAGMATITLSVSDGVASASQSFRVSVTPVNDAPRFAIAGDLAVDEDAGAQTVENFLTGASAGPANEAAQALTLMVSNDHEALFSSPPAIDLATGRLTFSPAANAHGAAHVTVTLRDDGGVEAGGEDRFPHVFVLTVNAVSDAPTAEDDDAATDEDTPVSVDVTSNDHDADGDALTISDWSAPAHGSLTVSGGTITYQPAENFHGEDAFTYTVRDGGGAEATAAVQVTVRPVNDAPVGLTPTRAAVDENAAGAVITSVTVNDPDVDDSHAFAVSDDRFEIVGGVLKLKAGVALDFEVEASVTVPITATDAGAPPRSVTQDVVIDVNDLVETLHPWQNPRLRWDVDDNGLVGLNDLLELAVPLREEGGPYSLDVASARRNGPPPYLDVNGDDFGSIVDMFDVVQKILEDRNAALNPAGEAEPAPGWLLVPTAASDAELAPEGEEPPLGAGRNGFPFITVAAENKPQPDANSRESEYAPITRDEQSGDSLDEALDAVARDVCAARKTASMLAD